MIMELSASRFDVVLFRVIDEGVLDVDGSYYGTEKTLRWLCLQIVLDF